MSDVVVSTTKSVTSVSTTDNVTEISITETPVEVSSSTAGLQGPPGANSDPTYVFVTNKTGAQLNKGSIVYVSGANGTHTQVSLALATGDVTSARTLGWLAEDIANNATGLCMVEGYLDGVNTQGVTEGAQLYLSPTTPGAFTETKPSAPDHMVYVGICAKASAGNGRVFVHVQNGAELEELHDVKIVSPANNDLLRYVSGTALWENVASTAVTVGSAISAGTSSYAVSAGTSVYANSAATAITSGTASYSVLSGTAVTISGSITKSQVSDFTSGTVTSASTAQQAGTAVYSVSAGTSDYSVLSGTAVGLSGSIVRSQVSDFSSGTVASAGTAQQAGTAVFATSAGTSITSGTADYSVLSGTAVTISGSITNSQVSDFASGTVANISGTVAQTQVANLTTDLAGKANLAGGNSFTGAQVVASSGTAIIPIVVRGTAGQSANITEWQSNAGGTVAFVSSAGLFTPAAIRQTTTGNLNSFGGAAVSGQIVSIFTGGTANKGLVVQGASGQSANLTEWQTSAGGTVAAVSGAGAFVMYQQNLMQVFTASAIPLRIRGASGQSANLLEIQNSGSTAVALVTSAGALTLKPVANAGNQARGILLSNTSDTWQSGMYLKSDASGFPRLSLLAPTGSLTEAINIDQAAKVGLGFVDPPAQLSVASGLSTRVATIVRGAASQSANLQEWQDSAGSTAVYVNSGGALFSNQGLRTTAIGNLATSTNSRIVMGNTGATIDTSIFSNTALRVQNTNSTATANLTEWLTSTGSTAAYVGSGGAFRAAVLQTSSAAVDARLRNAGGEITFAKATAVSVNPGANYGKIYFRDGTNAGTLKLVVIAGTAGAETTILDNIPQS